MAVIAILRLPPIVHNEGVAMPPTAVPACNAKTEGAWCAWWRLTTVADF
ncbi:MAG: hypothetical protein K6T81_03555 [Alicyclobacillus macrosporangiidus]|nr:hypothetical protein [Alicyclobacillus macrosporangiidus]MCL6597799.1 hypothetical protein [Alicyclobacillus macrosporangiidus]